MSGTFRAVAVDFDGTLTVGGRPSARVLDAIADARRRGVRVVLVTGRILTELREVFADVDAHFDAIVAENGTVIASPTGTRQLSEPVDPQIRRGLERRGHVVRSGRVLLACRSTAGADALSEIHRLGRDCHLVYNRGELMVVPAGTTKGTGLLVALADLGISPHSTIGVGDAENDHALLDHCEIGVAVANAVAALKSAADIVLDEPNGEGIAGFLAGPVLDGTQQVRPRRWQLTLGTTDDGQTLTLPASQINLLIAGASRSGKSYLTGLLAEQLIDLGYSVAVVDPEGDHTALGQLPGAVVVGGTEPLPDIDRIGHVLTGNQRAIVIDLTQLADHERATYFRAAMARLEGLRAHTGVPHWLVVDEAHEQLGRDGKLGVYAPSRKGHCLVTYRPGELRREVTDNLDALVVMPKGAQDAGDPALDALVTFTGLGRAHLAEWIAGLGDTEAVLVRRDAPHHLIAFQPAGRRTSHVRHWHKYVEADLPRERRFYFRRSPDEPTGAVAANLSDFHHKLSRANTATIAHHTTRGDFSRWIDDVFQDSILAGQFRTIEDACHAHGDPEAVRGELLAALETRYLG